MIVPQQVFLTSVIGISSAVMGINLRPNLDRVHADDFARMMVPGNFQLTGNHRPRIG